MKFFLTKIIFSLIKDLISAQIKDGFFTLLKAIIPLTKSYKIYNWKSLEELLFMIKDENSPISKKIQSALELQDLKEFLCKEEEELVSQFLKTAKPVLEKTTVTLFRLSYTP
jgi:hypothetical protein